MEDDWRFKQYLSENFDDFRYVEWKYFSFKSDKVSGFFCYSLGNPRDIFGLRKGIISYAIYRNNDSKVGQFGMDGKRCDLSSPNTWKFENFQIKKTKTGWNITGDTYDLKWDLRFKKISSGGTSRYPIKSSNKWMGWDVFSNLAEIEGSVKIDEKSVSVKGLGYHDSNYGNCKFSKNPWHWIRLEDTLDKEPIGITLFELRNSGKGRIYLSKEKKTYLFKSSNYNLKVKYDHGMPSSYEITAGNSELDTYFDLDVKVVRKDLLEINIFKVITLLRLNLLEGKYILNGRIAGKQFKIQGTARSEYPLKSFF
ncbi:MAG: hypothetical protein ACOC53_04410 [Candidatus Saliniplasma sp.]